MEKELLTIDDIRYDLRQRMRAYYDAVKGISVFLVICVFVFIAVLRTDEPVLLKVEAGILMMLLLGTLLFVISKIVKLYAPLKNGSCVVKDRLVGKYIKSDYRRYRGVYDVHCLRFFGYGEYQIPAVNYTWSELHEMQGNIVYFHADCDDEFYLVLSKPHTGKILMAYNTKMFEYEQ